MNKLIKKWWIDNMSIIFLFLGVIGFTLALLLKLIPAFPALTLKKIADANITELLNGAVFVTLIVERSAEVFISVWRDPEKIQLENKLNINSSTGGQASDTLPGGQSLKKYQQDTAIIAFYAGFFLGIVSALVGVRILEPLVDITQIAENQLRAFRTLDILLTGLTVSGGSKVFHELISVFTDFLAVTRKKVDPNNE
jgi:hypothetical protein